MANPDVFVIDPRVCLFTGEKLTRKTCSCCDESSLQPAKEKKGLSGFLQERLARSQWRERLMPQPPPASATG